MLSGAFGVVSKNFSGIAPGPAPQHAVCLGQEQRLAAYLLWASLRELFLLLLLSADTVALYGIGWALSRLPVRSCFFQMDEDAERKE